MELTSKSTPIGRMAAHIDHAGPMKLEPPLLPTISFAAARLGLEDFMNLQSRGVSGFRSVNHTAYILQYARSKPRTVLRARVLYLVGRPDQQRSNATAIAS